MLAYAANRPLVAQRRSSPNAMLLILAGHVAVIAVVMSLKMELPQRIIDKPIVIDWIDPIEPPPPDPAQHPQTPNPGPRVTRNPTPILPTTVPTFPFGPTTTDPGPIGGTGIGPIPGPTPPLQIVPVRRGAELLTPSSELRPPYPESKRISGEEALLKLRLTIDEEGRVIAVEPLGRADRIFLEAAKRHLIAHWRYRPASEDGRAVTSFLTVTLRFQLDG